VGRSYIRAIFFLGALVFLSRNAGEMTHELERAAGLVCFLIFGLSYIQYRANRRRVWAVPLGVIVLAAGLALLQDDAPCAVAALALATVGLWFLLDGLGVAVDDMPEYVAAALGFAGLLLLGKVCTPAWYASRWLASAACTASNALGVGAIDFRPTFVGLPITALLFLFWAARWLYSAKRRWQGFVWPAILTLLVQMLYLLAAAWALNSLLPIVNAAAGRPVEQLLWYQAFLTRSMPWNLPFVLFVMNVPVLFWGVGRRVEWGRAVPPTGRRCILPLAALVASLAGVALLFSVKRPTPQPIVFYEKGFVNWEVPEWGRYGQTAAGMFGNLPRFIRSLGMTSRMAAEITTDSLAGASALIITNLNHPLPTSSTAAIWRFVERGGTLLVLGDHTAYDPSGRVFVNELLAPSAIALNLDAAICPVGGWLHCYDFPCRLLTSRLGDERNEAGIVTGASLNIRWPARPMILGRYGYEDQGNRFRPEMAYLGNMRFDPNEPLGDTVLVAAQRYGRGRVLVFGDTSAFFNGILAGTYRFVGNVFQWIAAPPDSRVHAIAGWGALVVLIALAALALYTPPGRWTLLLLAVLILGLRAGVQHGSARVFSEVPRGDIADLDQAHKPMASIEGGRDDGLNGLQMNLMRSGLLPFNLRKFSEDTIAGSRLLVIVAPARRFCDDEVETVRRYLEVGGVVIVSVGADESYAAQPLLDAFDLELDENLPLGYFRTTSPRLGLDAMFWKAWAVRDRSNEAEVICGQLQFPALLVKAVGKGKLVLIGDSDFLLNKNLEGESSYNEVNIHFLRALLLHLGLTREAGK